MRPSGTCSFILASSALLSSFKPAVMSVLRKADGSASGFSYVAGVLNVLDESWTNGVDADSKLLPFHSEHFREHRDGGLGRVVEALRRAFVGDLGRHG